MKYEYIRNIIFHSSCSEYLAFIIHSDNASCGALSEFGEGLPQATALISIKEGYVSQLCVCGLDTAFVSIGCQVLGSTVAENSFFSLLLIHFYRSIST